LIVPLNELGLDEKIWKKFKAGEDITDILEIRKYEPEEDASPTKGESKKAYPKFVKFCLNHLLTRWIGRIWQKKHQNSSGGFPSDLISKSDETTLQNMKGVLEKYAEEYVYTSAKMEGQSFTVIPIFKGKKLIGAYPCSRNNAYVNPDNSIFWTVMNEKKIIQKMKEVFAKTGKAYIIQGEQVGVGIQQNIYNFSGNDWYVYTVKDYSTGKQLNVDDAVNVCKELGLNFVPIIQKNVKLKDIMPDVETAVKYAENKFWKPNEFIYIPNKNEKIWKDYFQHEGVVVRTMDYDKDNNVGCSFKVKNSDYASKSLSEINQLAKKSMTVREKK
jgi:glutaredoxin 2